MTELAFKNAPMLRAINRAQPPFTQIKDLATELDRDPANTRRALEGLRAEGLVERPNPLSKQDTIALTDLGVQVLAGIDVAEGKRQILEHLTPRPAAELTDLSTLPTWPLEKIVHNPANRAVDPDSLPAMADSLVENGQLQPVTLTPPDANGVRMLLIGERRWRGARLAVEQGRTIKGWTGGLRFEEREATEGEAVGIMIVENVERADMPPLELAFALVRYADLNGDDAKPLTGREVAARLGLGERDVLDKIRIARNATPEALAAYAEDGSWDRLRDSIPSSRKAPEKAEGRDPELRYEDPSRPNVGELIKPGDHVSSSYGTGPYRVEEVRAVSSGSAPSWSLILKGYRDGKLNREHSYINEVVADWSTGEARFLKLFQANDDEVFIVEAPAAAATTAQADAADPLVVNGIRFPNAARATEAKRLAGLIPNPSNSSGRKEIDAPLATDSADPLMRAIGQDWDRQRAGHADAKMPALAPIPDRTRLVLIEVAHKIGEQRRPLDPVNPAEWTGDPHQDFVAFGCTCGAHWLDADLQAAIAGEWIEVVLIPGGHPAMLTLTGKAVGAFMRGQDELPALPVSLDPLDEAQKRILGEAAWVALENVEYATACLNQEVATPGQALAQPADADSAPVDIWDRDADQIAADAALLDRVKAFADPDREPIPGDTALSLLQALGVDPSAEVTDAGGVFFETEHGPAELITVDAGGRLPDTRAAALAWLVAWAIETAIGGQAARSVPSNAPPAPRTPEDGHTVHTPEQGHGPMTRD